MRGQNSGYKEKNQSSQYINSSTVMKKENEHQQNDIRGLIERGKSRGHSAQKKNVENFDYTQPQKSDELNEYSLKYNKNFYSEVYNDSNNHAKMSVKSNLTFNNEIENSRRYKSFQKETLNTDEQLHMKVLGAREDLEINKKNMVDLKDAYRTLCMDNNKKQNLLEESSKDREYLTKEVESQKNQLDQKNSEIVNLYKKNDELKENNRIMSNRHNEFMQLLQKYMQISENVEENIFSLQEKINTEFTSNKNN